MWEHRTSRGSDAQRRDYRREAVEKRQRAYLRPVPPRAHSATWSTVRPAASTASDGDDDAQARNGTQISPWETVVERNGPGAMLFQLSRIARVKEACTGDERGGSSEPLVARREQL